MSYPYILGPDEHHLDQYYRWLSRWVYVCIPVLFLINEIFIRSHLAEYLKSPKYPWSILALALNLQNIYIVDLRLVFFGLIPLTAGYAITYSLLPKWNTRASRVGMKSGIPSNAAEYQIAFFYIENIIQKISFFVWHFVLMMISFLFGIVTPCMVINLFRSLP